MKNKRQVKNIWFDWLINYICKSVRKTRRNCFKDKVVNLFKTNTSKYYGKRTIYGRVNKPSKPKTKNQSEESIIKYINLFKLEKEKE